jgi:predicted lysophospholipase L1 biosynthesis ABC-type transport system permease subunit
LANRLWPGAEEGALGKRLGPNDGDIAPIWFTVVGVAENVADDGLREEPRELIYYSMVSPDTDDGWVTRSMTYVMRTEGPPASLAGPARAEVWGMNRDLPIAEMQDMETIVSDSTARLSFTMIALAIAAGVALLLGGIGLYGVLSYVVNQRAQEMGVRMALGAETSQVLWMVVRQGMTVVGTGLVVGIVASLSLTRVLESFLYGTSPNDPLTFVATSGVLLLVGLLASYVPARRASSINPMEALRAE